MIHRVLNNLDLVEKVINAFDLYIGLLRESFQAKILYKILRTKRYIENISKVDTYF